MLNLLCSNQAPTSEQGRRTALKRRKLREKLEVASPYKALNTQQQEEKLRSPRENLEGSKLLSRNTDPASKEPHSITRRTRETTA